jgi:hypothetical protein
LWDELVAGLDETGYNTLGYADGIAILVSRKFLYTVSELPQEALSMVQQWCERTVVYKPTTDVVVPFTKKRDLRGLKEPTLSGHKLQLATEVKYLGLTLDKESTWKTQLGNVINKAFRAFWTCKGTFGTTWGLKPKVLHWIYIMIIIPILTYGATVWWTRVNYNISRRELNKLETSLPGYKGGDEDYPNSSNGCSPGTPASACGN